MKVLVREKQKMALVRKQNKMHLLFMQIENEVMHYGDHSTISSRQINV